MWRDGVVPGRCVGDDGWVRVEIIIVGLVPSPSFGPSMAVRVDR